MAKRLRTAKSEVEQVAALYAQARATLIRAGRALHDHVGSSLSAAGLQLQLLRTDMPAAQARIDETLAVLEETLTHIRDISNDLSSSPAHRSGLKQALLRLAERQAASDCRIGVDYSATAALPAEIADALYEAVRAVLEQALQKGASRVRITGRGATGLVLRIADDGRTSGRVRALFAVRTIAREQGLAFECTTGKSTIVSIRYANRRSPRG